MLDFEDVKGLFKAEEAGTIPARYHVATCPEFLPKLIAVNTGKDQEGNTLWHQWFEKQNLNVLSAMIQGHDMSTFDEHNLALARNAILFKCPGWLVAPETTKNHFRAEAIDLADGSADWLSMASSFHWADFELATQEFFRVLRPVFFLLLLIIQYP